MWSVGSSMTLKVLGQPDAVLISVTTTGVRRHRSGGRRVRYRVDGAIPNRRCCVRMGGVYPTTVFIDEDGRITSTHGLLTIRTGMASLEWMMTAWRKSLSIRILTG